MKNFGKNYWEFVERFTKVTAKVSAIGLCLVIIGFFFGIKPGEETPANNNDVAK